VSQSICVIGPGRLGRAIAARLRERGHDVVLTREAGDAGGSDLVLLCVPDRAIEAVAALLPPGPWRAHCSGATGLDALGPGPRAFSVHPLMTFRSDGDPRQLDGVHAAISARDETATEAARAFAHDLGLIPFVLDDAARPLYHCAAAMAGSVTTAAFLAAVRAMGHAGLEPARAARVLAPLAAQAIANAAALPDASSLTGPVARGDAVTVERHLAALHAADPELERAYLAFVAATAEAVVPERLADLAAVLGA
jgi:predicted short-subunit dehydrogenase-like oxidoreductase (DUF2520 family)